MRIPILIGAGLVAAFTAGMGCQDSSGTISAGEMAKDRARLVSVERQLRVYSSQHREFPDTLEGNRFRIKRGRAFTYVQGAHPDDPSDYLLLYGTPFDGRRIVLTTGFEINMMDDARFKAILEQQKADYEGQKRAYQFLTVAHKP